jgi:hypothetical protein
MTLLPPVSGDLGCITVQAAFSPKYPSNSTQVIPASAQAIMAACADLEHKSPGYFRAFRPNPLVAVPIDLVQLQETFWETV